MNKLFTRFRISNLIDQRDHSSHLDIFLAVLVILMLIILPLIPSLGGQGYEQIKVLFFLSAGTIISSVWILASFKNPDRFRIKNTPLNLSLMTFIASLIITSAVGINFNSSLLGNPPYYQGIIVYLYFYLLFLIISTVPVKVKAIYWVWIISSVLVSIISLQQWIFLHLLHTDIPTYAGRVVSTFGQPSLYSGFLLFTLPVIISLFKQASNNRKRIIGAAFVINILGIAASESRLALLLSGGLLFFWIWTGFKHRVIKGFMVLGIFIVLLLGLFTTLRGDGIINQEIIKPLTGARVGEEGQERRVYIWLFTVDLIQKKPILGYGLDNLTQVFPDGLKDISPKPPFYFTVKDLIVDRAHNYILDLLISGGLVTFACWITFLFLLVVKAHSKWQILFLLIFFIYLQFQIQGIVQLIFFYTLAGLINREN